MNEKLNKNNYIDINNDFPNKKLKKNNFTNQSIFLKKTKPNKPENDEEENDEEVNDEEVNDEEENDDDGDYVDEEDNNDSDYEEENIDNGCEADDAGNGNNSKNIDDLEKNIDKLMCEKRILEILFSVVGDVKNDYEKVIKKFEVEINKIKSEKKDYWELNFMIGIKILKKIKLKRKNNVNFSFYKFILCEQTVLEKKLSNEIEIVTNYINKNVKTKYENKKNLVKKVLNFGNNKRSLDDYINNLDTEKVVKYSKMIDELNVNNIEESKPDFINVMERKMDETIKFKILNRVAEYEALDKHDSERAKYKRWIDKILNVPFGNYVNSGIDEKTSKKKIKNYLNNIKTALNKEIYGHTEAKHKLLKIMAQNISNPSEFGNVIGLAGSPGVGKTELMKVISKTLNRPFEFIGLGGIQDGSYLDGHGFTYLGSCPGKIVETIIKTKCMNPIIFFDELDKVSSTSKGEEIFNILTHLTDKTLNKHFTDKYFMGFDFDLSQALFIFTFNYAENIPRPLYDRLEVINVENYDILDKIKISKDFLLPSLFLEFCVDKNEIIFSDEILEHIIYTYTNEGGIRKLKEKLKNIISEINYLRYTENIKKIEITKDFIDNKVFKNKHKMKYIQVNTKPSIGLVNGLWMSSSTMIGGTLQIESCFMPSKNILEVECTGSLQNVIKESVEVAKTVAWRILPKETKNLLNETWNKNPMKINVHFPDGGTPKDGPSAGGAICLSLISLLTNIPTNNTYAMTGEINIRGQITKIGGLQEKILGAKKEGITNILCSKENEDDLNKIKEKYPNLFNQNFTVEMVETIYDIVDKVLTKKINYEKI